MIMRLSPRPVSSHYGRSLASFCRYFFRIFLNLAFPGRLFIPLAAAPADHRFSPGVPRRSGMGVHGQQTPTYGEEDPGCWAMRKITRNALMPLGWHSRGLFGLRPRMTHKDHQGKHQTVGIQPLVAVNTRAHDCMAFVRSAVAVPPLC